MTTVLRVSLSLSQPLGLVLNPDCSIGKASGQAHDAGIGAGCRILAVGAQEIEISSLKELKQKIKTLKGVGETALRLLVDDPRPARAAKAAAARALAEEAARTVERAAAERAAAEAEQLASEREKKERAAAATAAASAAASAAAAALTAQDNKKVMLEQQSAKLRAARAKRLAKRRKDLVCAKEQWAKEEESAPSSRALPHKTVTAIHIRLIAGRSLELGADDASGRAVLAEVVHIKTGAALDKLSAKYRTRAEKGKAEEEEEEGEKKEGQASSPSSEGGDGSSFMWTYNEAADFPDIALPPAALALRVVVIREAVRLEGEQRRRVKALETIGQVVLPLINFLRAEEDDGRSSRSSLFGSVAEAVSLDRWYDVEAVAKKQQRTRGGAADDGEGSAAMLLMRVTCKRLYTFSCAVCARRNLRVPLPKCRTCGARSGRPPIDNVTWCDRETPRRHREAFTERRVAVHQQRLREAGVAAGGRITKKVRGIRGTSDVVTRKEPPPPWVQERMRREQAEAEARKKKKEDEALAKAGRTRPRPKAEVRENNEPIDPSFEPLPALYSNISEAVVGGEQLGSESSPSYRALVSDATRTAAFMAQQQAAKQKPLRSRKGAGASSRSRQEEDEEKKKRKEGRNVDVAAANRVHSKLKSALYGTSLPVLIKRYDKNRSGTLDVAELRHMMRASLKIPPAVLSDADIAAFVEALDDDGSGELDCDEIQDFVARGVEALLVVG